MCIGSVKKSPNTESSGTTPSGTTPGKEQLALPAQESETFPYEVEEVEDSAENVMEGVRRS